MKWSSVKLFKNLMKGKVVTKIYEQEQDRKKDVLKKMCIQKTGKKKIM